MTWIRSVTDPKEQRQLHCEPACEADSKASRFQSSRLVWVEASLVLGVIEMVIPEQNSTQIIYCQIHGILRKEPGVMSELICK